MTKLKIFYMAIFIFEYIWVTESAFCCIFFLKNRSIESTSVLRQHADVKQKGCRVSVIGKKIIFHYLQLDVWLIIS